MIHIPSSGTNEALLVLIVWKPHGFQDSEGPEGLQERAKKHFWAKLLVHCAPSSQLPPCFKWLPLDKPLWQWNTIPFSEGKSSWRVFNFHLECSYMFIHVHTVFRNPHPPKDAEEIPSGNGTPTFSSMISLYKPLWRLQGFSALAVFDDTKGCFADLPNRFHGHCLKMTIIYIYAN